MSHKRVLPYHADDNLSFFHLEQFMDIISVATVSVRCISEARWIIDLRVCVRKPALGCA